MVLLSGGLDSVTVLAVAAKQGFAVHAMSFAYGQRHLVELSCAARQAERFGARAHEVVDLSHLGRLVAPATALVRGSPLNVPKGQDPEGGGIPSTYVPARNTLFLSYGLAWAEVLGARHIFIGVNALDYSGYPDCRPVFIEAFERTANLATKIGVEQGDPLRIETPLQELRKHEIVTLGLAHGVDYGDTVSCYDPSQDAQERPLACGACDSCQLRRSGFELAGVDDPTRYV
ncbi:MAG: 7-cyano-7-deazaguanine synthase QueC [Nannocystaceae bacterium]|nr:7-cyano-7-deazaguanine synthase QueC [Nannocystaceae bacterium]